jgi:hypothetical protein
MRAMGLQYIAENGGGMRRRDWVEVEGTVASAMAFQTKAGSGYTVVFTYKVDGHFYGGTFTTMRLYFKGDRISVKYDPSDPDRNNLVGREQMMNWFYAVFFVLLGLWAVYLFLQPKVK